MPKFSSFTSKNLLKILKKAGFEVDHISGSHHILYHHQTMKRVTVPFHCKDLPKGTVHSILKSAGISKRDLEKML